MSVEAMTWALGQSLSPPVKLVLICVGNHAWPDGTHAFPGVPTIAAESGMSQRQVQRILRRLVDSGYLTVEEHAQGGRGHPTSYRVPLTKGDIVMSPNNRPKGDTTVSPNPETQRVTPDAEKGDICDIKGDICDIKGDICDTALKEVNRQEPSKEPSREPSLGAQRAKAKRATGVPDEFAVSEKMRQQAIAYGISADRIESETEAFLDFHRAKGTTFKDWEAGWRTWMRNAVKFDIRATARASPSSHGNRFGPKGPDASWFAAEARRLEALGE